MVSETFSDSSARNIFFSFLMISQVDGINSNNLVCKMFSDSSARNVFFCFLMISQVGDIQCHFYNATEGQGL